MIIIIIFFFKALSYWYNITEIEHDEEEHHEVHLLWESECPLLRVETIEEQVRLISEVCMFVGALTYIVAALLEARFLGMKMFIENLVSVHLHALSIIFLMQAQAQTFPLESFDVLSF